PSPTTWPSWPFAGSDPLPWCEPCSRYWPGSQLGEGGECPDCDAVIGKPAGTPWHFKLLLVATVIYLGWRTVQGIEWLVNNL
ncbi:MAG: hypothetical protein M3011_01410, partial [Actinomycetota bacterium]|nr:hypothetical protein [Actinomycetota bacterium]